LALVAHSMRADHMPIKEREWWWTTIHTRHTY